MKVKKLRIGNYVLDYEAEPEVSIYWKVEEIQRLSNNKALNQTLGVTYRNGSCWTCDPKPIPLTQDWLINFGFDQELFSHNFFNIIEINGDDGFYEFYYNDTVLIIKHVHQLQNLYFALTNKELIII
jgi:hypothetical protein